MKQERVTEDEVIELNATKEMLRTGSGGWWGFWGVGTIESPPAVCLSHPKRGSSAFYSLTESK